MVNNVLSSLPTLINEKGYLFGIDMVGGIHKLHGFCVIL